MTIFLVVLLVLAVAAAIILIPVYRKRQSVRLKSQFGPEYDRTVERLGGRSQAEAELRQREARIAKLNITPLTSDQAGRFKEAWKRVQGRFVDDPRGALKEAGELVQEVMTARGYPMGDFERRASDISVDHATVVEAYRAAQAVAIRDAHDQADTEELRTAFVHYRTLFAELLGTPPTPIAARRQHIAGAHP